MRCFGNFDATLCIIGTSIGIMITLTLRTRVLSGSLSCLSELAREGKLGRRHIRRACAPVSYLSGPTTSYYYISMFSKFRSVSLSLLLATPLLAAPTPDVVSALQERAGVPAPEGFKMYGETLRSASSSY